MSIRMYVWKLTDREKDGLQLFYAKYGKNKSIEIVLAGEHEPDKEKEAKARIQVGDKDGERG